MKVYIMPDPINFMLQIGSVFVLVILIYLIFRAIKALTIYIKKNSQ